MEHLGTLGLVPRHLIVVNYSTHSNQWDQLCLLHRLVPNTNSCIIASEPVPFSSLKLSIFSKYVLGFQVLAT